MGTLLSAGVLKMVGALAYMVLEYFLGRTDLIKSGSVLELVLNLIQYVFNALGITSSSVEELKEEVSK